MDNTNKIKGAIYGFAYGDSWGKNTEFMRHEDTLKYNQAFPNQAIVTDDTQMSLYALYAIMYEAEFQPEKLKNLQLDKNQRDVVRVLFADSYLEFFHDEDNNRAPGMTCMKALRLYELSQKMEHNQPLTGLEGVQPNSKGCGANMRSGWLGLLPLDEDTLINLSILQSETTHGHQIALSASVLTTLTVKAINEKSIPETTHYIDWAIQTVERLANKSETEADKAAGSWTANYHAGLLELKETLENGKKRLGAYLLSSAYTDICTFFGDGWVAEEAYLCALIAAQDAKTIGAEPAMWRLTYSGGDSDSLAAIGGMFIGADQGFEAYPAEWQTRLETRYADELSDVTNFLQRINS